MASLGARVCETWFRPQQWQHRQTLISPHLMDEALLPFSDTGISVPGFNVYELRAQQELFNYMDNDGDGLITPAAIRRFHCSRSIRIPGEQSRPPQHTG